MVSLSVLSLTEWLLVQFFPLAGIFLWRSLNLSLPFVSIVFFEFKILGLDLLDCISVMMEICEYQTLDEKINYFKI